MKAEESLNMQEIIISGKHNELAELIANKQVKLQLLNNKKKELEEERKNSENKHNSLLAEHTNKLKKYQLKKLETDSLEATLNKLEKELPRPLEDDYNALLEENNKITKELVKYEKLCNEAIKAKSNREKEMYEEYYEWEKKQALRQQASQKKNEECRIY